MLRYAKDRSVRTLGKKKGLPGDGNEKYMAAKPGSGVSDASRGQAREDTAIAAPRLLFEEKSRILTLRLKVHLDRVQMIRAMIILME